jgi:hypothetical protein
MIFKKLSIMEILFVFLVALGFGTLIGYLFGNAKKGIADYRTNEMPNILFRVIFIDKTSAILEEVSVNKKRRLVSSQVFGGKPIRPRDIVRKARSEKERIELGIDLLGYAPLIKVPGIKI